MVITCYSCSTSFSLDESLLKPEGTKVRCSRCKHFFKLYPPAKENDLELEDKPYPGSDQKINLVKKEPARGKEIPDLDLDESEFSYLELTDLVLDSDLGIELDESDQDLYSNEADADFQDAENESDGQEIETPELELDEIGLELDDDGIDQPDFEIEMTDNEPDHISMEDDDPEFELELNSDPGPSPAKPVAIEPQFSSDKFADEYENNFPKSVKRVEQYQDDEAHFLDDAEVIEVDDEEKTFSSQSSSFEQSGPARVKRLDVAKLGELFGSSRENKSRVAKKSAFVLLALILVGVGIYLAGMMSGYRISDLLTGIPNFDQNTKKESAKSISTAPVPNQKDVNARYADNLTAGRLFIITGTVVNSSADSFSHIQVKGELISKDKVAVKTGFAFCGTVLSEDMLKTGKIEDIHAALSQKKGMNNANENIKPGASVPYMLVFSNLPDHLQDYRVQVASYDKN